MNLYPDKKEISMRPAVIFSLLALGFGILFPSLGQAINIAPVYGVASANAYYEPLNWVPAQAIDDNWETRWEAPGRGSSLNPYWLQVDLQGTYEIDTIVLVGPKTTQWVGYTNDYNLYNSTNGTAWTKIASGTLIDTTDYVHTIYLTSNQSMRYAKYEVVGGNHWAKLYEMEIYPVSNPVPLPGSLMLLGSGLLGAALWRARSKFMG